MILKFFLNLNNSVITNLIVEVGLFLLTILILSVTGSGYMLELDNLCLANPCSLLLIDNE